MMMANDKTDHCSCQKPPGQWSDHGVHWREFDDAYIESIVLHRWPPEWGGTVKDSELTARLEHCKNENLRRHITSLIHLRKEKREWLSSYKGQAVFVCECPLYVEAVARNRREEKNRQSDATARQQAPVRLRA